MNNAPAFQHYIGDFLSHPIVALMTAQEVGAYWLLVNYCWKLEELPDDIEELAIYARLPVETFEPMWTRRIQRCFQLSERKTWIHPHLETQRIKHENIREIRQKASGARWHRQGKSKSDANTMQMDSFSVSSSSSTSIAKEEKDETNVSSKKMKKGCRIPDDFYPSQEMLEWTKTKAPNIDLESRILEFKNYWSSKTGKDATKLDWGLTFQNRIIAILEYQSNKGANDGTFSNGNNRAAQTAKQIESSERFDAIIEDSKRFKTPQLN